MRSVSVRPSRLIGSLGDGVSLLDIWAPRLLSVLRIVVALLFLEHGTQKLLAFPHPTNPQPALYSLVGAQGLLEAIGGLLLAIGLFVRPVALLLSGDMAVAYFMAHAPRSFFPALNGGDAAILYCFVFFYMAAAGGGVWGIDAARASPPGIPT